ncbi:IclR family transcriptional regulator [Mycobacterium tuberculosis]|nr:IclR family transcriptional regulator [Mycobacterium tuberculosis]
MSSTATSGAAVVSPAERVEVLFEELAELAGQRNAIDGRIVEIVAELDRDGLWGVTGARSVAGLVAWKMGCSSGNAHTIATVARRVPGVSALRPGYAGGAVVVGSGWGDRGAGG